MNSKTLNIFITQLSFNAIFRLISVGISFLTYPILYNNLGINNFGYYALFSSFVIWGQIFDFGIANSIRRRVSDYIHHKKESNILSLLVKTQGITFCFALMCSLIVYLAMGEHIADLINIDKIDIIGILTILSAFMALTAIRGVVSVYRLNFLITLEVLITNTVFLIILVLTNSFDGNLKKIYFSLLLCSLGSILFINTIFLTLNYKKCSGTKCDLNDILISIKKGFAFLSIQMLNLFLFQSQRYLLAELYGSSSVTEYDIGYKIFSIALIVNSLLSNTFLGELSRHISSADKSGIIRITRMASIWLFGLMILSAFIYVAFPQILHIWIKNYSDNYTNQQTVFICVFIWLICVVTISNGYLIAFESIKNSIYLHLISILVFYTLTFILWKSNLGPQNIPLSGAISLVVFSMISYIFIKRLISNLRES